MRQFRGLLVGLTFFGILQPSLFGQATAVPKSSSSIPPVGLSVKPSGAPKIVFVVNGVGQSTLISDRLEMITEANELKVKIQNVAWCRAGCSSLEHYKDHSGHLKAASAMAARTSKIRKESPDTEIYYVGHSTGARIALLAAEMAPEKSVNRIILIASAVGHTYDLRPALRASRNGIDHFWSPEDEFLDLVAETHGLPDGSKGRAAGQVGFHVPAVKDGQGRDAYKNVRQFCWSDQKPVTGGHFAWTSKIALKRFVVPMIVPQAASAPITARLKR